MFYNEILIVHEDDISCLSCYQEANQEPPEESEHHYGYYDYIPRCHQCHGRERDVELTNEGLLFESNQLLSQIKRRLSDQNWLSPPFDSHQHRQPDSYAEWLHDTADLLTDLWDERTYGRISNLPLWENAAEPVKSILGAIASVLSRMTSKGFGSWDYAEEQLKAFSEALTTILDLFKKSSYV